MHTASIRVDAKNTTKNLKIKSFSRHAAGWVEKLSNMFKEVVYQLTALF